MSVPSPEYAPVSPEKHRCGHAYDRVVRDGFSVGRRAGRVGDIEPLQKRESARPRSESSEYADVQAQEDDVIAMLFVDSLQGGHLTLARGAGSRPEVENHRLRAEQVLEVDLGPAKDLFTLIDGELEVGCDPGAPGDLEQRVSHQCHDQYGRATDDVDGLAPLRLAPFPAP